MNLREIVEKVLIKQNKQHTFCYCPICKNELCGSNSLVSDTKRGVLYKCSHCGCKSLWDFDIFPVPYIKKYQHLNKNLTPEVEL